jgi:WD40 repeat protein
MRNSLRLIALLLLPLLLQVNLFYPVFHADAYIGGVDAIVNLYSTESNTPMATLSGHSDRIARIAFHPDGRHLVSARFAFHNREIYLI